MRRRASIQLVEFEEICLPQSDWPYARFREASLLKSAKLPVQKERQETALANMPPLQAAEQTQPKRGGD